MKCFSKSTRSFASVLAFVLAAMAVAGAAPRAADVRTTADVRLAVQAAVASRMGEDVVVRVDTLEALRLSDEAEGLVATPEATGRVGQPVRFTISARTDRGRTRVGEVTATVSAAAEVVRAVRPLLRGEVIAAGDVRASRELLTEGPFRPVPTLSTAVGARVTRDIAGGAVVGAADLLAEPVVKSNTTVRALVRIGTVDIEADVLAMDAGARGDIIRVTNVGSRRVFRARVTGRARVEVIEP